MVGVPPQRLLPELSCVKRMAPPCKISHLVLLGSSVKETRVPLAELRSFAMWVAWHDERMTTWQR